MFNSSFLSSFLSTQTYLQALFPYLRAMLQQKLIDQVHLWDFSYSSDDRKFLQSVAPDTGRLLEQNIDYHTLPNGLFINMGNFDCEGCDRWIETWDNFYLYYSGYLHDDDVLMKCDDDVIYLDIDNFQKYLTAVRQSPGLVFANILNNDGKDVIYVCFLFCFPFYQVFCFVRS